MPLFDTAQFNAALFGGTAAAPGPVIQVGQGLLYPALRKAGVTLGPQRTPSPAQFQDAIDELNRLLGSLACDPLWVYGQEILNVPLSGKSAYTIGVDPAADMPVPVPKGITEAVYVSNDVRYPLAILTPQLWANMGMHTLAGAIPESIYFDKAYPVASIYIYGQPTGGTLELYVWKLIPGVAALADVVIVPAGYEDAIVLNLACRLAPHFQLPVHPDVREQARESMTRLMSLNAPQPILSVGFGCCHDDFDIYSGS